MPTDTSQEIAALQSRLATLEEAIDLFTKELTKAREREESYKAQLNGELQLLVHLYYSGSDRHRSNIEELSQHYFFGDGEPPQSPQGWTSSPNLVEKYGVPREAVAVRLEIRVSAEVGSEAPANAKSYAQMDVKSAKDQGRVYSVRADASSDSPSDFHTLTTTVFLQDGKFAVRVGQLCSGAESSYSRVVQLMGYLMPAP